MKHLRRLIWYAASRLMLITLVLGMIVVTFYYAMNATNIYIVLKDGMARRAQVVMMEEDPAELNKYFQQSFLERDSVLIATDISCGVVPVDPLMRAWREACGRMNNLLAEEADEVWRLFCGLPQRLK